MVNKVAVVFSPEFLFFMTFAKHRNFLEHSLPKLNTYAYATSSHRRINLICYYLRVKEGVLKSTMHPLNCNSDIFLEIIKVLSALGRYTEAQEVLSEAQPLCQSESEEFFLLTICCQLALQQGDLDRAGELASSVLYICHGPPFFE